MPLKAKLLYLLVATAVMTASCSDDHSWAPPYITDFAELTTDDSGAIVGMALDNGKKFERTKFVAKCANANGLVADTVYRSICLYTVQDNVATLHSYSHTFAPEPITPDMLADDEIKTDPCVIQSIWRGGSYVNALMLVQGKDQPHIVGFIDKWIADGEYKTLTIVLYHDQNNDPEAFTRTIYISCPLYSYEGQLHSERDSIAFVVNQQDKGMTTFMLPY